MATIYPKISDNPSANEKLNLGDFKDTLFDVYRFTKPNFKQVAFFLFVVKNKSIENNSNLIIEDIIGNDKFTSEGFSIDPMDNSGNLLLGLISDNKLKTEADLASDATNTGYGIANTTHATTGSCTGAEAFVGYGSSIEDSSNIDPDDNDDGGEFNQSGCDHLMPVYTTDFIKNNAIPGGSYASFIVRCEPESASTFDDETEGEVPTLTIKNNDDLVKIKFLGKAVNNIRFYGDPGTLQTINTGDNFQGEDVTASFISSSNSANSNLSNNIADETGEGQEILDDGYLLNLGLYPVGYLPTNRNLVFKFGDHSSVNGLCQYIPLDGFEIVEYARVFSGDTNENAGVNSENYLESFPNSFVSPGNSYYINETDLSNDANRNPVLEDNAFFFKSFEYQTGSTFTQNATPALKYPNDKFYNKTYPKNEHTVGVIYKIAHVINGHNTEQTEDDKNFIFSAFGGFYDILTYNEQPFGDYFYSKHLSGDEDSYSNYLAGYNSTYYKYYGTALRGYDNGATSFALRSSAGIPIGFSLQFNQYASQYLFDRTDSSGQITGRDGASIQLEIPEFNIQNSFQIASDDGATHLPKFSTEDNISSVRLDGSGFSSTDAIDSTTTSSRFNGYAIGSGQEVIRDLGLKWLVSPSNSLSTMYSSGDLTKVNNWGGDFGIYSSTYHAVISDTSVWQHLKYTSQTYAPKFKIGYQAKPSVLNIVTGQDLKNSNGVSQDYKSHFFADGTTDQITKGYSMQCSEIVVSDWYHYNSTTPLSSTNQQDLSSNTRPFSTEGSWYGAGLTEILKPKCWNYDTSRWDPTNGDFSVGATGSIPATKSGYYSNYPKNNFVRYNNGSDVIYNQYYLNTDKTVKGIDARYFSLPSASYNPNTGKWRSVGRLYFHNTGDYPIYIQSVNLLEKEFKLEGVASQNSPDSYQGTLDALMPDTNKTYKPTSNSATPSWGFNKGYKNGGTKWVEDNNMGGYGSSVPVGHIPDDVSTTKQLQQHYQDQDKVDVYNYNRANGLDVNKKWVVETLNNGDNFSSTNDTAADEKLVITGIDDNYIDITFDLTPTNVAADDEGTYYVQLAVSYWVADYYNTFYFTDNTGLVNTAVSSTNVHHHSRLQVSKFLIAVNVEAVAEIAITDTEGDVLYPDLNDKVIEMPNLSID